MKYTIWYRFASFFLLCCVLVLLVLACCGEQKEDALNELQGSEFVVSSKMNDDETTAGIGGIDTTFHFRESRWTDEYYGLDAIGLPERIEEILIENGVPSGSAVCEAGFYIGDLTNGTIEYEKYNYLIVCESMIVGMLQLDKNHEWSVITNEIKANGENNYTEIITSDNRYGIALRNKSAEYFLTEDNDIITFGKEAYYYIGFEKDMESLHKSLDSYHQYECQDIKLDLYDMLN